MNKITKIILIVSLHIFQSCLLQPPKNGEKGELRFKDNNQNSPDVSPARTDNKKESETKEKSPKAVDLENLNYSNIYSTILVPKCLSCHDGGTSVNYDLTEEEMIKRGHIIPNDLENSPVYYRLKKSSLSSRGLKNMPLVLNPLTNTEIKLLEDYIKSLSPISVEEKETEKPESTPSTPVEKPPITIEDITKIFFSKNADRSDSFDLNGATLNNNEVYYIHFPDKEYINHVEFFLNGASIQVEGLAPYDMGGTNVDKTANNVAKDIFIVGKNTLTVHLNNSSKNSLSANFMYEKDDSPMLPTPVQGGSGGGGGTVSPSNPVMEEELMKKSYEDYYNSFLMPKCLSCHGQDGTEVLLDLSQDELINKKYIVPQDLENSPLYYRLIGSEKSTKGPKTMPFVPLTEEEILLVETYINGLEKIETEEPPASPPLPAEASDEVKVFYENIYTYTRGQFNNGMCLNCHTNTNTFISSDDVMIAYEASKSVVNFSNPIDSELVKKAGDSHCAQDCSNSAEILRLVNIWAQAENTKNSYTPPAPKEVSDPRADAGFYVPDYGIALPVNRFYIETRLKSIFGETVSNPHSDFEYFNGGYTYSILEKFFHTKQDLFGGVCDKYKKAFTPKLGSRQSNFSLGCLEGSVRDDGYVRYRYFDFNPNIPIYPGVQTARMSMLIRACNKIVDTEGSLNYAAGKIGASLTQNISKDHVRNVYQLFHPGRNPSEEIVVQFMLLKEEAKSKGQTNQETWNHLFNIMCSSPSWQII